MQTRSTNVITARVAANTSTQWRAPVGFSDAAVAVGGKLLGAGSEEFMF
jgi:hypothetical protein